MSVDKGIPFHFAHASEYGTILRVFFREIESNFGYIVGKD
jgi:hypothetical protein